MRLTSLFFALLAGFTSLLHGAPTEATPDEQARYLAGLECDFDVLEPDDVRRELRALGERLLRVQ